MRRRRKNKTDPKISCATDFESEKNYFVLQYKNPSEIKYHYIASEVYKLWIVSVKGKIISLFFWPENAEIFNICCDNSDYYLAGKIYFCSVKNSLKLQLGNILEMEIKKFSFGDIL